MVGIQGIGGIPEPANSRQVQGRGKGPDTTPATATDGVEFSPEAVTASEVIDIVAQAADPSGLRQERIEQARQDIEQGVYKIQQVVLQLASRLARFVE